MLLLFFFTTNFYLILLQMAFKKKHVDGVKTRCKNRSYSLLVWMETSDYMFDTLLLLCGNLFHFYV